METWDAIRSRRNVRRYTGQPIARHFLVGPRSADELWDQIEREDPD
jgi:hypothetical protein